VRRASRRRAAPRSVPGCGRVASYFGSLVTIPRWLAHGGDEDRAEDERAKRMCVWMRTPMTTFFLLRTCRSPNGIRYTSPLLHLFASC